MGDRELILTELHALLCSTKGAITPKKLSDDYYQVTGNPLPYRKFGYNRIEDFLQSAPNTIKCSFEQGVMVVQAVKQEKTAHIQELVARQRKAKKKSQGSCSRPNFSRSGARGGYNPLVVPPRMNLIRTVSMDSAYPRPLLRQNTVPLNPLRSVVYIPPHSTIRPLRLPVPSINNGNVKHIPPLMSIRPPAVTAQPNKAVYRDQLKNLSDVHNLGSIEYSTLTLQRNSKRLCGIVTVNGRKFSTYPHEFDSEDSAFEAAAKEALESFQKTNPVVNIPETSDPTQIAHRVVGIVSRNDQGNGYWSSSIEEKYVEEFKERLPINWVNAVKSVTGSLTFHQVKENSYAVYLSRREETSPSSASQSREPVPPEFPSGETFVVHVLVVLGVDQVAVRLTNSELYQEWEDMMNDIEIHYTDMEASLIPVKKMDAEKLYVARIEKSWMRVQLDQALEDDKVRVVLVDHADTETIPLADIFEILPRFCRVPCQGLMLRLFGLSSLNKWEGSIGAAVNSAIKHLLDMQFTAQAIQRDPEMSVILYQSGEGNATVNVNELILADVVDSLPLISRHVGNISHVSISYISSQGDVYVISDTPQQNIVEDLLAMVAPQAEKLNPVAASDLNPTSNSVYLVQSATHGWRRATLCSAPAPDGNIFVRLIDLGDGEIVPMSKTRPLATLSPLLARMPGQAIKVRMARVPPSPDLVFTEKAAQRLREIAPRNSELIMRIIDILDRTVPVVELFQRVGNNNVLGALNTTLEMESGLYRPAPESRVAALDSSMANLTIEKPLVIRAPHVAPVPSGINVELRIPPPKIPEPECEFGIHVCNVSSPFAFYVQPVASFPQLNSMMQSLQEYCRRPELVKMIPPRESVVPGAVFAGLHTKTCMFHRVQVEGHVHGDEFLVYFVDYGDKEVCAITNLRPLTPMYCQLPAQAMKARLAGVQPKGGDWGMEEVLIFKKLVDDKDLYSFVTGVSNEILQLHIIDTNGDADLIISRHLVDRKLAVFAV